MSPVKLMLAEIGFRKINFLASLSAVAVAAALLVAGPALIDGYGRETDAMVQLHQEDTAADLRKLEDETRKLMRDIGFNLLIVHKDARMEDLWAEDYSDVDMPQAYVDRLAAAPQLTLVAHLVATLKRRIKWQNSPDERPRTALLIGYLPERVQAHREQKKPMGMNIEPGTVVLGYELGGRMSSGDTVDVLGKQLTVASVLPEKGGKEDITINVHLADAQAILDKPGRINQILALGCQCEGERLPQIRAQLADVLPETKITEHGSIAVARAEQRDLVAASGQKIAADLKSQRDRLNAKLQTLAAIVTPLVLVVCGTWVGLLALTNVRDRRPEIGLLRAIGKGSPQIAALFIGRALLLGLAGGALGVVLGWGLSHALAARIFDVSAATFQVDMQLLLITALGAPLLAAMASYLPTLSALSQDPSVVLNEM